MNKAFIGKIIGKLRTKAVVVTDQRVKLMNEVLSCIKLIKMYAWEKSFAKVIGGNIHLRRMIYCHAQSIERACALHRNYTIWKLTRN